MGKLVKQIIINSFARMECEGAEFDRKHPEISEEIRQGEERMEKAALNRRLIRN